MPRRREVATRQIVPDTKYNSLLIAKFTNGLTKRGKKSVAQKTLYGALDIIEERTKQPPLKVFNKAVDNVKPLLEVKSRRVGGSTYQVPIDVSMSRRQALAIRWIINFANKRNEKSMAEKLANELIDAFNNKGASIKKREDTHKMAEANKAFAHYRW